MQQARSAATEIMFGQKIKDPEFRRKYVNAMRAKKGLEEE